MAASATVAALALMSGAAGAAAGGVPINPFGTSHVGTEVSGRILLPDNQWIQPYGQRTEFNSYALGFAISPDGTKVAVQAGAEAGTGAELRILSASTGTVLQTFGGVGMAPPVYSPDGTALYAATATNIAGAGNALLKYTVGSNGLVSDPTSPQTIPLAAGALPYGLVVSPDGTKLYAALSGLNELAVIDTSTSQITSTIPVGNAPQSVAIVGNEAFVANRAGRLAGPGDTTDTPDTSTVAAEDGNTTDTLHLSPIVSDPVTGATTTGTVSVVNLTTNEVTDTVNVGLQPTSLTVHDGSVFVANANSDTVSIVDAVSHQVTQTFNVEPLPGSTVGSAPNSVTFVDPHHFLVSVGADNALAEFLYNGPTTPVQYQGLIPTDWDPSQIQLDSALGKVIVSNRLGVGADGKPTSGSISGSVTSFGPPSNLTLGRLTREVFDNNGWDHMTTSNPNDKNRVGASTAIPTQLGQPSAIKHVFLIINENKTYDSVLGDIGKGNSDPSEAIFGGQQTPNKHSLANTFALFDNFYDPSWASFDGHQWIDQADANDYIQQDASTDFGRTGDFEFEGGDPLAYQRDGFLWNTVEAAGKSVKDYGEYESITNGTMGTWQQYYADSQILEGMASGPLPVAENAATWSADVPSLNAIRNPEYPNFQLNIPDQYRVDIWNQDFQQQLETNSVPNLTIMWLPDDHTGGGAPPTTAAQVADGDLADGRVISEISHSSVWKNSAIFVEEDDPSEGTDNVDGHRAPLWIASPYATRAVVNNNYYTQINVTKTIEQILGAQPMNQIDRAAVPMFSAFTNKPNFAPYDVVPNEIPLTQGVTGLIPLPPPAGKSITPVTAAALKATSGPPTPPVPAAERSVAAAWANWSKTVAGPMLSGPHASPDSLNPAQLSRYDWYVEKNWSVPYPGDNRIFAPDRVPGRNVPGNLSGD